MISIRQLLVAASAFILMAAVSSSALAQAQGGGQQRGQGRQRGQGGNFDPAQARERMMNALKERLGATDDEWKVLQPKIEKVMTAQRDSRGGGFGGRGNFGGRNRGNNNGQDQAQQNNNRPQSEVSKAAADLRAAIEDKSTPAEEINKKLAALREAREKARAELQAAQKELKEVLSARQEAVLVSSGMLE
jgi:opacity protein-like surface antigen